MNLHIIDWIFIFWYFIIALGIGIIYARRAGKSITDYFISGRSLPWWVVGTSMVATTFASDTPLAVTGFVANHGIAGNWLWWSLVFSGTLTIFFFSRLWRRAEVITDVEIAELRYYGKPAAFLRCFRALYLGIPITGIIFGWVTLAMAKILGIALGWNQNSAILICLLLALIYTTLSGFWGVVTTDILQFSMAMTGSIFLAIISVSKIGGISSLKAQLVERFGTHHQLLDFFPVSGSEWMPAMALFVYLAINWWAAWYPGSEPGGGGFITQRMFAAKDEKHSLLATLWFNIAHYGLRPWPWILVALVSVVAYPHLSDPELGYPKVMIDFLPIGLRGLMVAAFLAAYMSTIDSLLNLAGSYLTSDVYKQYLVKNKSTKHYVIASRISIIIVMAIGGIITSKLDTVAGAWKIILAMGAGTGLVYILRWYWWRINAWSEISAMSCSFIISTSLNPELSPGFIKNILKSLNISTNLPWEKQMIIIVSITTVVWLIVTFLTKPVKKEHLIAFYKKVKPGGFWKPITKDLEELKSIKVHFWHNLLNWLVSSVLIYTFMFGTGKIILGFYTTGLLLLITSIILGIILYFSIKRTEWYIS
ncbi:sodium:proline symporter, partial [candidate division KSB1 bacterium]